MNKKKKRQPKVIQISLNVEKNHALLPQPAARFFREKAPQKSIPATSSPPLPAFPRGANARGGADAAGGRLLPNCCSGFCAPGNLVVNAKPV